MDITQASRRQWLNWRNVVTVSVEPDKHHADRWVALAYTIGGKLVPLGSWETEAAALLAVDEMLYEIEDKS